MNLPVRYKLCVQCGAEPEDRRRDVRCVQLLTNARLVGYCLPRAKFNIILPMAEWLFGRLDRRNGLSKKEHILIGRSRE
jgi:hypothetical protein